MTTSHLPTDENSEGAALLLAHTEAPPPVDRALIRSYLRAVLGLEEEATP